MKRISKRSRKSWRFDVRRTPAVLLLICSVGGGCALALVPAPLIAGKALIPKPGGPRSGAHTVTYGRSRRGRPLQASVLGQGPNVTLIVGGFHGNERATPGVVDRLRAYLAAHPSSRAGCRVVLVRCANPDGWAADTRVNAHGVDLNRNFPEGWKPGGRSGRHNPGLRPASEPETQAFMRLLKTYAPTKVISIHAPLHCLNGTGQRGLQLARLMHQYDQYPVKAQIGYPTPGSLGEYCGDRLGLGMVTLELPNESAGAAWSQNRSALIAAILSSAPPRK